MAYMTVKQLVDSGWFSKLSPSQVDQLLILLLECAVDSEWVRIDEEMGPYWEGNGEPLVELRE